MTLKAAVAARSDTKRTSRAVNPENHRRMKYKHQSDSLPCDMKKFCTACCQTWAAALVAHRSRDNDGSTQSHINPAETLAIINRDMLKHLLAHVITAFVHLWCATASLSLFFLGSVQNLCSVFQKTKQLSDHKHINSMIVLFGLLFYILAFLKSFWQFLDHSVINLNL